MRYLKLYKAFFTNSLMRDVEYRSNFFISLFHHLCWIFIQIFFFTLIFKNIREINGWNYTEMLFLLGTFLVLDSLIFSAFVKNFSKFFSYVLKSELDLVLAKPVNSQFFVSTRYFASMPFLDLLFGFFVILLAFKDPLINFELLSAIKFAIFFVISFIVSYSIWFLSCTIIFFLEKIETPHEFFIGFWQFAKFPDIYKGATKIIFLIFMPAVFAAYVPVGVFLGKVSSGFLLFYGFMAVILFYLTTVVWRICLRRYTSAGG